ncbi:hypothetical protein [Microbacterium sp. MMO-10]|uniref:hypothetical protein n=1 Tax=Microbacterium sp. MMO-10 TaxID=3081272 RepID=UPI003017D754
MTDYTPTTEEVRAAWIDAHRVDTPLGGRMDMEARPRERIREFDRWMASVLAEQGEPDDYWVLDANGDFWASSTSLEDARHYLAQEPGGWIEAVYRNRRLPVEENKSDAESIGAQ